ncbi:MAG: DUF3489 domain-containing protein [Hyphomicrobium sp.]|jgi:hypothetical protein|nr:DUF3489 domain-containing protein [Hyphomicrobium sp.]
MAPTAKSKIEPKDATQNAVSAPKAQKAQIGTKAEIVISLIKSKRGATIQDLMKATDWQAHSVRGFLAGTVKKKLGLDLTSSKSDGGVRRYRITARRGR